MDYTDILDTIRDVVTTTSASITILKHFVPDQPKYIKDRFSRTWQESQEYLRTKIDEGDSLRNDWFSEKETSNRHIPIKITEKVVKQIVDDAEKKKSKYIGRFRANVCLTSNSDIDESTAFSYLEEIEPLTWRQLCIIRLVILYEDKKVNMISIEEEGQEKWIEQMPQDKQTSFYSISREYENLAKSKYFEVDNPMRFSGIQPPLLLLRPELAQATPYTRRLHSLMNLHEIRNKDIEEIFSLWNVKFK